MRFRHRDGTIVHLAYCTNVHPAEDLDGVVDQLGRYAEPSDLSAAVRFLASEGARHITGATLDVNGGYVMV